ncbi:MAG: TraR/DksA C4-type zinc finger protein [Candidatus Omnitrophica bacterium]|nr:TraR/DksA C4-type zinc finger protein [Candidatus Omnitrophota bacterium]
MKKAFNKKDLEEYQEKLFNIRDDISNQMRQITNDNLMKSQKEMSGDISGYGQHMADVASDSYERDFNLGLVSSEREIILSIDDALKRISNKTYGLCQQCEKPISKNRLEAIPYAEYCIKCKEKLEKENSL